MPSNPAYWRSKFKQRLDIIYKVRSILGKELNPHYHNEILVKLYTNSIIDNKTNCFLWQGALGSNGHGRISFYNKLVSIHRLIMFILKDFNLNSELQINHKRECPNANCWNVEHLYVGDQKDNMQDRRATITHCIRGHEFNSKNTLINKNGSKCCRICHNEQQKNRK